MNEDVEPGMTFGMGCSCQAIFSDPDVIRPAFSKTPHNQLSTQTFMSEIKFLEAGKYQSLNNLA